MNATDMGVAVRFGGLVDGRQDRKGYHNSFLEIVHTAPQLRRYKDMAYAREELYSEKYRNHFDLKSTNTGDQMTLALRIKQAWKIEVISGSSGNFANFNR